MVSGHGASGLGGRVQQVFAVCLVGRGQAVRGGGKALALTGQWGTASLELPGNQK